jgi:hypothetical protein
MGQGLNNKKLEIEGGWVKIGRLEEEWYEDLQNPAAFIEELRTSRKCPDVFTFWQRLPDATPRYDYVRTADSIAAIPLTDYKTWWEKQISSKTRNMVRRAEKKGVVVRQSSLDDEFARGMASIFNEVPVRQGRRFLHYGKDAETIKREFSRFLFREEVFGAYVQDELAGFSFIAYADRYACLGQILSKIAHRDKATTNLLVAKAVERCVEKGIPHLVYAKWIDASLGDFKRHNGFQKFDLPRYFVPLTFEGRCFLALNLHRGLGGFIPPGLLRSLKRARRYIREGIVRAKPQEG